MLYVSHTDLRRDISLTRLREPKSFFAARFSAAELKIGRTLFLPSTSVHVHDTHQRISQPPEQPQRERRPPMMFFGKDADYSTTDYRNTSAPYALRWRSSTFYIGSTIFLAILVDLAAYGLVVPVVSASNLHERRSDCRDRRCGLHWLHQGRVSW